MVRTLPEVVSSLKLECSTFTTTPTELMSNETKSCSAKAPSVSRPALTSPASVKSAGRTSISRFDKSLKSVTVSESTPTISPVSPANWPRSTWQWSPMRKCLITCVALSSTSALKASWCGKQVSAPSACTLTTVHVRLLRSPSMTRTVSPGENVDCTAERTARSMPCNRAADSDSFPTDASIDRNTSTSSAVGDASTTTCVILTVLIRKPSSNRKPAYSRGRSKAYAFCLAPRSKVYGSKPAFCASAKLKSRAAGRAPPRFRAPSSFGSRASSV
mmetsp:Transcript_28254/g.71097  ORF Transcript_28254/g.71097 Transcript_28254/m.71097 type:complete len:274 (-) Transcript_28254:1108-1929(-)